MEWQEVDGRYLLEAEGYAAEVWQAHHGAWMARLAIPPYALASDHFSEANDAQAWCIIELAKLRRATTTAASAVHPGSVHLG